METLRGCPAWLCVTWSPGMALSLGSPQKQHRLKRRFLNILLFHFLPLLLKQLHLSFFKSFYRFPPTYCAPRSLNPTCTTSPSWWPRSTRPPRPVCSEPSSRPGWAPGWRSPRNRTSSHSHPDGCAARPQTSQLSRGRCGMCGSWARGNVPRGRRAGRGVWRQGPVSTPGISLQQCSPF